MKNQNSVRRPGRNAFLLCVMMACSQALAQDRLAYRVELAVNGNELSITSPSNCEDERPPGEICVPEGRAADIVFSIDQGSEDWMLSMLLIRDPALNWLDPLPESAAADFGLFDRSGVFHGTIGPDGSLTVSDENSNSLAVQYKVVAKHRQRDVNSNAAHSVIDNSGGGAPAAQEPAQR